MSELFDTVPWQAAEQLEQLSRILFELREDRKRLLARYGVDSADALLDLIREGALAEHPAYDHYLAARLLESGREAVRDQLRTVAIQLGG